jgi:hypothetical protein
VPEPAAESPLTVPRPPFSAAVVSEGFALLDGFVELDGFAVLEGLFGVGFVVLLEGLDMLLVSRCVGLVVSRCMELVLSRFMPVVSR